MIIYSNYKMQEEWIDLHLLIKSCYIHPSNNNNIIITYENNEDTIHYILRTVLRKLNHRIVKNEKLFNNVGQKVMEEFYTTITKEEYDRTLICYQEYIDTIEESFGEVKEEIKEDPE